MGDVRKSNRNVFEDAGFDVGGAENLKLRAQLTRQLEKNERCTSKWRVSSRRDIKIAPALTAFAAC